MAVATILNKTDFDVFLFLGNDRSLGIRDNPRITVYRAGDNPRLQGRAAPFLQKFLALSHCLRQTEADAIIMADADTLFVNNIDGKDVLHALAGKAFGMVEQRTIVGSDMKKEDFHEHFTRYSLSWIAPEMAAPTLDDFRYFNSGIVLGRRESFKQLVAWALDRMGHLPPDHRLGDHMIADQDYFQVWANCIEPGSCISLPWRWNHCDLWDEGFPRPEPHILHFSNFCLGPGLRQILRMAYYRFRFSFQWKGMTPRELL